MNDHTVLDDRLRAAIGSEADALAVYLLHDGVSDASFDTFQAVTGHRYCQLLMRARHGESVRLDGAGLACPAAAAAFGFRPLPDGLASGKGLVGFGIVAEPDAGRHMFEGMTRLEPGSLAGIAACPLARAPRSPDVVVVEGPVEALMWIALANQNVHGGQRSRTDTAILQATCVDATVIPFVERRLNFGLGCYGCREATDLGTGETVLGFPGERLSAIVEALEVLASKAIPRARQRPAHQAWKRATDETGSHDPGRPTT